MEVRTVFRQFLNIFLLKNDPISTLRKGIFLFIFIPFLDYSKGTERGLSAFRRQNVK